MNNEREGKKMVETGSVKNHLKVDVFLGTKNEEIIFIYDLLK